MTAARTSVSSVMAKSATAVRDAVQPWRSSDASILLAAAAIIAVLALASYVLTPPDASSGRASTYSTRGSGAKAAFLLLTGLGYRVERSFEPIASLRADPASTVLILASPATLPSNQDRRALRAFIERGGIVLATGAAHRVLPDLPGKTTDAATATSSPTSYRAAAAGPLTTNAAQIEIAPEIIGAIQPGAAYTAVYRPEGEANAGVLEARIGRGRAIWWIGSSPLLNRDIDKPGHLELLLNILATADTRPAAGPAISAETAVAPERNDGSSRPLDGARPATGRLVLWDEHYHGHHRGIVSYIAATPLPAVLAQLGLIAVVAIATFSRRRGPVRPLVTEPRASSMEFVEAMAQLYEKARAAGGAVEIARARLRRLLVSGTQVPAASSDERVAAAAAARYHLDARELHDLLRASAAAADAPELSAGRALTLAQRLQDASAAIVAKDARG